MRRSRLACALCAVVVIAAGCVNTTGGTALPADTGGPTPPGAAAKPGQPRGDVEHVLLSAEEINDIMGATDMELMDSDNDMADHRADISDPKCLGALYNAEQSVYDGSGWTDVVDQVLTEPEDDSAHWVEQTAVQFPSREAAMGFLNLSMGQWTGCIGKDVMVNDGEFEFQWVFESVSIRDHTMSQTARQTDADGWSCQHAMGAVDDVIVESSACGVSLQDEAVAIAGALADNVN